MLFNSLTFLVFFATVFLLFKLLRSWEARKWLLLVASYMFYTAWNPPYVLILIASTCLDWWLARLIWREDRPSRRRLLLIVSLVANLSLLAFFKYGGFVLSNAEVLMAAAGVAYHPPLWDVVLPVGISFYTFASLSYTIDVYRKEIAADTPLRDYALFVAFFPHLVAGPIVRARALLPQIARPTDSTREQIGWGLMLVAMGLFCKSVLADTLLAPVADIVYAAPGAHPGAGALAGVFAFAGQIYFDFGGYSLCAIGLAMCFGFAFPDNFRFPYAARGFSDFWRRWHISLSTWLRDYLYIPLGGNRGGEWRTCRNLMLTMLLGGLWHGASWMFVLWGALHGSFLVAERVLRRMKPGWFDDTGAAPVLTVVTFLLVCLAWIPFRAPDMATGVAVLTSVFRPGLPSLDEAMALLVMALAVAWQWRIRDQSLEEAAARWSEGMRGMVAAACLVGLFMTSGGDSRAFIYFQF
ncbi:MBOAT family O-acyltransferase [Luteibacter sp. dw_328]|uniref:MBOAT family O-acyltransferase n=1 Tax=Luteibacter sp. dw_328 TaxID=2719796 RepID=UPI001BD2B435